MNHSLSSLISSQHALELDAHVSVDDAVNKAYEEAHELSIAIQENDSPEIQKEARDVLINVLSVSSRYIQLNAHDFPPPVFGDVSFEDYGDMDIAIAPSRADMNILSLIALWGRETASIRGHYSREKISLEKYRDTVLEIIRYLLPLIGSDIRTAVMSSLDKFRSRVQEYLPDMDLGDHIAEYRDFPKPGILFRDISPLLAHPEALRYACYEMARHAHGADVIAGLDARGFIFGTRVAEILGKPFVMIRKKGKLPGNTVGVDYSLEYGDNSIEMQSDAIRPGDKVAIMDDLLATGGTLRAAADLVEKVGGQVHSLICLISLDEPFLREQPARQAIESRYKTIGILHYDN